MDRGTFIGWILLEWWRLNVGLACVPGRGVPFLDLGFFKDTSGFLSEDVKDLLADFDLDRLDLTGDG